MNNSAAVSELELHAAAATGDAAPIHASYGAPPSWALLLAATAVFWLLGLAVRRPYLDLPFMEDDYDFLFQIGLVQNGKLSYWLMLAAPQGPHPMPAWKACYYLEWRLFGLAPPAWRMVESLIHAVGATALFSVLRRYLASSVGAGLGALLWSAAAVGNWDNPHAWLMCGMIPLAVSFLLLAMALLRRIGESVSGGGAWLFGLSLAAALLSWGDVLAFFPLLALQYLWFERLPGAWWGAPRRWWIAAAAPTLLLGTVQSAVIASQLGEADRKRSFTPVELVKRTAGQMANSLGTLSSGDVDPRRQEPILPKTALAAALASATVLLPGPSRRLALLFLAFGGLYALLTNVGGASMEFQSAVQSGHYLYVPVLAWCVVAACWAAWGAQRRPKVAIVAAASVFALFCGRQRTIAESSQDYVLSTFQSQTALFEQNCALIDELAALAARQERTLRLPEFPIPMKAATSSGFWPASALLALRRPEGDDRLRVVPVDRALERDYAEAASLLQQSRNPIAPLWIERMYLGRKYAHGLAWLSEFGQRAGGPIRVPDFWIAEGTLRCKAGAFLALAFSSPPRGLTTTDRGVTRAELSGLVERLRFSREAPARTWINLFDPLSRELP